MKTNLLVAAALCVFAIGMKNANAATGTSCLDISGCTVTINGDSGVTAKRCTDSPTVSCDCLEYVETYLNNTCPQVSMGTATTCPAGYGYAGVKSVLNKRCCYKVPSPCPLNTEEATANISEDTTEVQSSNLDEDGFADVFAADESSPLLTTAYWGYANAELRSPSGGRGTFPEASLDACMGHTDVNYLTNNFSAGYNRWNACVTNTTYGCPATAKNEHCRATGLNDGSSVSAAVCKDRCDCAFGQGTYGTCEVF